MLSDPTVRAILTTSKEKPESFEIMLIKAISDAQENINNLEELTKPIPPENSIGRISRMDAINNKSVAEAALRSSKRKLSKLRMALTNIDLPGFGDCERCKQPIPPMRLMFMPESTRCVRCAE